MEASVQEPQVTEHGDEVGEDGLLVMPVMFRSRGVGFRAVLDPKRPQFDAVGVHTGDSAGEVAEFKPDGTFETRDPAVVKDLMARDSFNLEFFRVGMEPGRAPDSAPVLDRIMQATIDLDVKAIEEILEAERAEGGHNRGDVIGAGESSLRRLHGLDVGD